MQTSRFVGLLLAGVFLAPIPVVLGQTANIAYGTTAAPSTPKADYLVFLDRGGKLSAVANETVRMAAEAVLPRG